MIDDDGRQYPIQGTRLNIDIDTRTEQYIRWRGPFGSMNDAEDPADDAIETKQSITRRIKRLFGFDRGARK